MRLGIIGLGVAGESLLKNAAAVGYHEIFVYDTKKACDELSYKAFYDSYIAKLQTENDNMGDKKWHICQKQNIICRRLYAANDYCDQFYENDCEVKQNLLKNNTCVNCDYCCAKYACSMTDCQKKHNSILDMKQNKIINDSSSHACLFDKIPDLPKNHCLCVHAAQGTDLYKNMCGNEKAAEIDADDDLPKMPNKHCLCCNSGQSLNMCSNSRANADKENYMRFGKMDKEEGYQKENDDKQDKDQRVLLQDKRQKCVCFCASMALLTERDMPDMDIICLSAGIDIKHCADSQILKLYNLAQKYNIPIVNDVELFYRHFSPMTLAVTGSYGKSTVVSMCDFLLTQLKIPHALKGNIGIPIWENILDNVVNSVINMQKMNHLNKDVITMSDFDADSGGDKCANRYAAHHMHCDALIDMEMSCLNNTCSHRHADNVMNLAHDDLTNKSNNTDNECMLNRYRDFVQKNSDMNINGNADYMTTKTDNSHLKHDVLITNKPSLYSEKVLVLEVSNNQLERMESFAAQVGVLTNIYPHHLSRYDGNLNEYIALKLKLLQYSQECVVGKYSLSANLTIEEISALQNALNMKKQEVTRTDDKKTSSENANFADEMNKTVIWIEEEDDVLKMNARYACEAVYLFIKQLLASNVFDKQTDKQLYQYLSALLMDKERFMSDYQKLCFDRFVSLEHRQEIFYNDNNVVLINDSKSTDVHPTIAAIKRFLYTKLDKAHHSADNNLHEKIVLDGIVSENDNIAFEMDTVHDGACKKGSTVSVQDAYDQSVCLDPSGACGKGNASSESISTLKANIAFEMDTAPTSAAKQDNIASESTSNLKANTDLKIDKAYMGDAAEKVKHENLHISDSIEMSAKHNNLKSNIAVADKTINEQVKDMQSRPIVNILVCGGALNLSDLENWSILLPCLQNVYKIYLFGESKNHIGQLLCEQFKQYTQEALIVNEQNMLDKQKTHTDDNADGKRCYHMPDIQYANDMDELCMMLKEEISNYNKVEENKYDMPHKAKLNILFSPGCQSFDAFANFEQRGKIFKEKMLKLLTNK